MSEQPLAGNCIIPPGQLGENQASPGGHWLNRERLSAYPRILLAALVVMCLAWILLSKNLVDPKGRPLGCDFIQFWAASYLALAGHAESAYDVSLLFEAQKVALPTSQSLYAWYYPPAFGLIVLPLALLPYLEAYLVFMLATLGGYLAVLSRIVKGRDAIWCLAAFSGAWMNFIQGQNAFLTAALAGATLLCLEWRPILAGVLMGLLAIKPHLALLFPVALIAIGAWRSLATAGLVAVAFVAAGTLMLGLPAFEAWFRSLGNAWEFLKNAEDHWLKMPTVFAALRMLGVPVVGACIGHFLVAAAAAAAVWKIWRRCPSWPLRSAALMTATCLASPYLFDYDLAWLAFPIAWIAQTGLRDGWQPGEREALVAAWILPLVMAPIAMVVPIQIGPLVLLTLLWFIFRRAACGQPRPGHVTSTADTAPPPHTAPQ